MILYDMCNYWVVGADTLKVSELKQKEVRDLRNYNNQVAKFDNIAEFAGLVDGQDDYRLLPVFAEYADRKIGGGRVFGMVNIDKNRVTMACGKRYPVFGHKEALGYVVHELAERKCDVHGSITTVGDTTWTKILFKGIDVTDAKDSKVELGVEFVNPMDRKTRFKGYGYTFRQTCSNGNGIKTLLPNMEINESHTVDMDIRVPPLIHDFIGRSLQQTNHLQKLVTDAMAVKVVFESRQQMTQTLSYLYTNVSDRHVKVIAASLDTLEPTRWDLFNASNFYTSHHPITPNVREDIDVIAESFLNTNRPITPVIVRQQVAPVQQV
jgi:hypothetical protein